MTTTTTCRCRHSHSLLLTTEKPWEGRRLDHCTCYSNDPFLDYYNYCYCCCCYFGYYSCTLCFILFRFLQKKVLRQHNISCRKNSTVILEKRKLRIQSLRTHFTRNEKFASYPKVLRLLYVCIVLPVPGCRGYSKCTSKCRYCRRGTAFQYK
jgi:hypothetical protein